MNERIRLGEEAEVLSFPYNAEDLRDDGGGIVTNEDGIVIGDRMYDADDEALVMKQFIANGVFPNPMVSVPNNTNSQGMRVLAHSGMTLTLRQGAAFVEGRRCVLKRDISVPVPASNTTLGRRDIVIVRHDVVARTCWPELVVGIPAISPQVPALVRNDDIWDIQLCVIAVNPNATAVTNANITDTRMDNNVCGFVTSLVTQVDTRDLFLQIQAQVQEILAWWADERRTWDVKQDLWEAEWLAWYGNQRAEFERLGAEIRGLIQALETQSFNLVNHDFDADWARRGCVLHRDPSNFFRETWTVESTSMLLAVRTTTFNNGLIQIHTQFFPWQVVEGSTTIQTTAWQQTRELLDWDTMRWRVS